MNGSFPSSAADAWKYANQELDDIITIDAPMSGVYYITVFAYPGDNAQYQIIVVSSGSTTELADGINYPMSLAQGGYAYYSFRVPSDTDVSRRTLMIAATPLRYSGDLSVYCSYVHTNPSRTAGMYEFSSESSGCGCGSDQRVDWRSAAWFAVLRRVR